MGGKGPNFLVLLEITHEYLEKVEEVNHNVTQYVDGSLHSVGAKSMTDMKLYIEQYMTLLEGYYHANKLQ